MTRTPALLSVLCLLGLTVVSCAEPPAEVPGYSGMAQLGPSSYLVVHDTKRGREGPRLGRVEVTNDGTSYAPIRIVDWPDDGPPSDLESACEISGRSCEFLVAESGCWGMSQARAYRVCVNEHLEGKVLGVYDLPCPDPRGPDDPEGDNYEGLACAEIEDDRILVLLGERGGSKAYPRGLLRWGVLDLEKNELDWMEGTQKVTSPGQGPRRDIAALHLDSENTLWAAAVVDPDEDLGPFRSWIYPLGQLTGDPKKPVEPTVSPVTPVWTLDGLKVEGISAPAKVSKSSRLSLVTEDENLGGVWRPLAAAEPSPESDEELEATPSTKEDSP